MFSVPLEFFHSQDVIIAGEMLKNKELFRCLGPLSGEGSSAVTRDRGLYGLGTSSSEFYGPILTSSGLDPHGNFYFSLLYTNVYENSFPKFY